MVHKSFPRQALVVATTEELKKQYPDPVLVSEIRDLPSSQVDDHGHFEQEIGFYQNDSHTGESNLVWMPAKYFDRY